MNSIVIIQTVLAFFMGVGSLLLVHRLTSAFITNRVEIKPDNQSYGIFQAGLIISTALILGSVVNPAVNAIRLFNGNSFDLIIALQSIFYVLMFLLIGVIFTLLIVGGGVFVLFRMTSVNEWEELSKDNRAIAIVSAAVLIGLAIVMDQYVGHLCELIIPYPETLQIR